MRDGLVVHGAEGALGGAVGTLLVRQSMMLGSRMPENLKPPMPRSDPGDFVVSWLESLRGRPLPARVHERIVAGLPWAYGVTWGCLLGLAVAALHVRTARRTILAGAAMGALVWAVGYLGWLPRAGLMEPVHRQGAGHLATSLAQHVLYGVAASVPVAILDRAREQRRPWWQKLADALQRFTDPRLRKARRRALSSW